MTKVEGHEAKARAGKEKIGRDQNLDGGRDERRQRDQMEARGDRGREKAEERQVNLLDRGKDDEAKARAGREESRICKMKVTYAGPLWYALYQI